TAFYTLSLHDALPISQAGEVYLETFRSQAIGRDYKYTIYLPDDYKQGSRRYPVLYLLHGAGGDENEWLYKGGARETLDAMIARRSEEHTSELQSLAYL